MRISCDDVFASLNNESVVEVSKIPKQEWCSIIPYLRFWAFHMKVGEEKHPTHCLLLQKGFAKRSEQRVDAFAGSGHHRLQMY